MRRYHLLVLLRTIYEASPADELLSLGFTPGQLSGFIIEAIQGGFLVRNHKRLFLSEAGIEELKILGEQCDLIRPDGQWIKESKDGKLDAMGDIELYIPKENM